MSDDRTAIGETSSRPAVGRSSNRNAGYTTNARMKMIEMKPTANCGKVVAEKASFLSYGKQTIFRNFNSSISSNNAKTHFAQCSESLSRQA